MNNRRSIARYSNLLCSTIYSYKYIYTHFLWKSSLNRLSNNAEQKHDNQIHIMEKCISVRGKKCLLYESFNLIRYNYLTIYCVCFIDPHTGIL